MRRTLLVMAGLAAALAAPGQAAAQLRGMPAWNSPKGGTGFTIAADFGSPDSAGGGGSSYAGRVVFGMSILTLSAAVGSWKADGAASSTTQWGGDGALRLIGGSLIPVSVNLQGGFATYSQANVTTTRGLAALGFAIDIPTPGVSVEPWIAPGLRLTHAASQTDTQFGIAGGLTIGFGMLGIHAAMDYENLAAGGHTTTLGIGAHFSLRPAFGL